MKDLVKRYLDEGISRRQFLSRLSLLGMSTIAARTIAQSLTPFAASAQAASPRGALREVTGSGGALFVEQLRAAGVEYVFFNPATGDAPIYDAMVDAPGIHLIKGIQEGAVAAMADGYARASGKPGVAIVAAIGLPNAMTQMVNTFKDGIPMLVVIAATPQKYLAGKDPQYYDHQASTVGPITKWAWTAQSTHDIPEMTRRALKFAATPPSGPVFLSIPEDQLRTPATSTVMDMALDVSMPIRPDNVETEKVARMLIEAKNPLLSVGDEVTLCRGEKEVVQLAELLGLPVAGQAELGTWSKPFPTRNPLYIGPLLRDVRFPGQVDMYINIGNRYAAFAAKDAKRVSIRQDPTDQARTEPAHLRMVADVRLATADLIEAIKSMATESRLKQIATGRASRIHEYTKQMAELRKTMVASVGNGSAIGYQRLATELENGLDRDTIYVTDCDSGEAMNPFMSFGGADKTYIATGPRVLGWAAGAGLGVKLARPDRPVVAILGDGAMMFGGPQPLWSMARYSAPITTIISDLLT